MRCEQGPGTRRVGLGHGLSLEVARANSDTMEGGRRRERQKDKMSESISGSKSE